MNTGERLRRTDRYAWISQCPQRFDETRLRKKIQEKSRGIPFKLISIPGREEALVICRNEQDARRMTAIRSKRITVSEVPFSQCFKQFRLDITFAVPVELQRTLEDMDIDVNIDCEGNKTLITTLTLYQMEYACLVIRQKLTSITIELRDKNNWYIVQVLKADEILGLRRLGYDVTYVDDAISIVTVQAREEADEYIQAITSCARNLGRSAQFRTNYTIV